MRPLVMVGAGRGSLPRIVAEAAAAGGRPLSGYVEFGDNPEPPTTPLERLGDATLLGDPAFLAGVDLVVAVQGSARRPLALQLLQAQASLPPLAHPAATISTTATLGAGTVVSAGVIVQSDARIGRFCLLNTAASIDHDNSVGDFVSIAPGVHTAGYVTIEDEAYHQRRDRRRRRHRRRGRRRDPQRPDGRHGGRQPGPRPPAEAVGRGRRRLRRAHLRPWARSPRRFCTPRR
jgi:hypothetical protein